MDILLLLEEQKSYLEEHPDLVREFIAEQGRHSLCAPTLGGEVFWITVEIGQWKFQVHTFLELCRVLDFDNESLAYGTPEEFSLRLQRKINEQRQQKRVRNRELGLVFSGGGAKGAYEIGVWRYLRECGLDKQITGISGTSVGALNGLLFLQGDYDCAEKIWRELQDTDMFRSDILTSFETAGVEPLLGLLQVGLSTLFPDGMGTLAGVAQYAGNEGILDPLLMDTVSELLERGGIFSQEGIEALIRKNVDWEKIERAKKLFYCTVADNDLLDPAAEYRCLNGLDREEIINSVLQSSAIPVLYGARRESAGNKCYVDGGIVDTTPIRPLLRSGYRELIVVHLRPRNAENEEQWQRPLHGLPYDPDMLHHIWPSEQFWDGFGTDRQGDWRAMVTADPALNQKRMEIGYEDAKKQLERFFE